MMNHTKYLQEFVDDRSLSHSLEKKYDRNELLNAIRTFVGHSVCEFIRGKNTSYTDMQTDIRELLKEHKRIIFTINYTDSSKKIKSCVACSLEELNTNVSGIEMDNGTVNFVVDKNGIRVTAEQIGAAHVESF